MSRGAFHLAQLNIALPKAPLDTPLLAEFVAQLDTVNAAADSSPGFIWRLQTDDGNATGIRAFDDHRLIVNMSVWESLEALRGFVYSSRVHLDVLRRRRDWFERRADAYLVLWWIEAGQIPTVADAEARLALLQARGPTQHAFTFRAHFPPPAVGASTQALLDDRELCPAG